MTRIPDKDISLIDFEISLYISVESGISLFQLEISLNQLDLYIAPMCLDIYLNRFRDTSKSIDMSKHNF